MNKRSALETWLNDKEENGKSLVSQEDDVSNSIDKYE